MKEIEFSYRLCLFCFDLYFILSLDILRLSWVPYLRPHLRYQTHES